MRITPGPQAVPAGLVRVLALSALLLGAGLAPRAFAQGAGSATRGGTAVDASGGVLPGAEVTLVNLRTTARRTATTGPSGAYVFVALASGDYKLKASLPGFRPWESSDVHLSRGDSLEVEAKLDLAGQREQVEVTAVRERVRTDQGAREGAMMPVLGGSRVIDFGSNTGMMIPGTDFNKSRDKLFFFVG